MKQVRPVTGANLIEFAEALNEAYCELSRFRIEKTEKFSDLEALIHYDIPDDIVPPAEPDPCGPEPDYRLELADDEGQNEFQTIRIEMKLGTHSDRYCCECDNYEWGRKCPYRRGHIKLMDKACCMFNIIIERS